MWEHFETQCRMVVPNWHTSGNVSVTASDRNIVTVKCKQEVVCDMSNSAIDDELE